MKKLFTLFLSLTSLKGISQTSPTSADIYMGLRKLNVLGSVLYVAAHPDDENTRLLTYFSKDRLYRTGYLSLTRGDGGQNLIGNEQGIDLGLIRTHELLAARKIDGAEQFFTRAYDFGFSKNPQETFTKWDKEKILADVVWVIRQFQPDVIITRFPTTGEGGHGHHTASAILANEAFTAAADPKRFPEQLKWVQPWQAKRILWNTFNFGGGTNTQSEDQFKFDVGSYNPILGKSYGEIAAESRSQHKSQGFGVARSRGEAVEYFKTTGGKNVSTDLFEDITISWQRVKEGEKVGQQIQAAIASYDFTQPHKSVPQLIQVYRALENLPDSYWKTQKLKETQQLIEDASGLWLETVANTQFAVQNDSLRFITTVNNRLGNSVKLNTVTFNQFDTVLNIELAKNKNLVINKAMYIPASIHVTQPYWLRDKMQEGYFNVNQQELIGRPDIEPAFTATYELVIEGMPLTITKPVRYKYTDPVKGELYQPVTVVPAVSIHTQPPLVLFKKGETIGKQVSVEVGANKNLQYKSANILLRNSSAITAKDGAATLAKGTARPIDITIKPSQLAESKNEDYVLPFVTIDNDTSSYYLGQTTIRYDHIPNISRFYTDAIKLVRLDLKTQGKRIGYIVGAGDQVPEALEEMGYEVTLLTNKELSRNNLKQFDAIIAGVRAYNTNEWLNKYYEKLMKYVEEGGNLIVQYNTSNQIGPVRAKIGPYNFNISRNRVTDENAPVNFLKPEHQVLNYPNKISSDDFKGWVQERSIYHATDLDKKFETIISMSDPGEQADANSLIVAKHGRGYFTYTGLVFFRQLPAGVPGAYRLLANLIALNQKKEI